MRLRWLGIPLLLCGLCNSRAAADNRIIVRTTLGLQGLQQFCSGLPVLQSCSVVGGLGDPLGQLFLITTPVDLTTFLNLLGSTAGIVDAEADQLVSLVGGLNQVTTPPAGLTDSTPVSYSGTTVWNGYVNQPAAQIVRVSQAQSTFRVAGTGIVADIDTGVDPNHPVLKPVLLPGYDFTRNQPGGSEMTDFTGTPPSGTSSNVAQVNQSTAAVLDQSTAAVLDTNPQYSAFGHGTMVMGIIHLVAPQAQLLPLKAFSSNGTGYLSDILRAAYYGVQNGANVINMSFDFKTNSLELTKAMDYANQNNVICAASAGNDGMQEIVYPAALQNDVMGVASTSDTDSRSSFSNYGNAIVWVAAPGEAIISTYPFGTYAAGWGTSFSTPFVSGGGALLLNLDRATNESKAAAAVAHAVPVGAGMGNGRLDLVQALQSVSPVTSSSDFGVSLSPGNANINAGQSATFTFTVTPSGGFNQVVVFSCSGAPADSTCTVSPSSVTLDGTHASSASVVVTTNKRSSLPAWPQSLRITREVNSWNGVALLAAWILFWLSFSKPRAGQRSVMRLVWPSAVILAAAFCSSCGGGVASTAPPPPTPGGTPAGTSAIVVTGTSGNVSHAATAQLNVN
jgi:hypothetical protein